MERAFAIFFWLLFVPVFGFTQHIIAGKIVDHRNNEPVESAVVHEQNGRTVLTDAQGNFKIKVSTGISILNISMIGYYSKSVEINDQYVLTIYLETGPVD